MVLAPPQLADAETARIEALDKDLKLAASTMGRQEARFLVQYYYMTQDDRKRANNQVRAIEQAGGEEPHDIILWLARNSEMLEKEIAKGLGRYANSQIPGLWAQTVTGIGPVISAGLLAHFDISRAPYASGYWRFAGLDPSIEWLGAVKAERLVKEVMGDTSEVTADVLETICERINRHEDSVRRAVAWVGKRDEDKLNDPISRDALQRALAIRPWNGGLKTLMWKIGQSFVKSSGSVNSFYGPIYRARKQLEVFKNGNGDFADQAAAALEKKNYGRDTDAYKAYAQGMLPPAQLEQRAERYATKIFIAHYHWVCFEDRYGVRPDLPYPLAHLAGHDTLVEPPRWKEMQEALLH